MTRFGTLLLLLLAFVSGAAALIYEVVFFRSLGLVFGVSVHAVAAVVGSFLLGLGLGAAAGGRYLERFVPLRAYAAIEAAIALCGYASPFLFRQLKALSESGALGTGATFQFVAVIASFLVLVVPTALMGATFPLLGRAIAGRSEHVAARVGWLYGVNTLGAAVGAVVAAYFALPELGVVGATHLAAGLNVLLAIASFLTSANPSFDGPPRAVAGASTAAVDAAARSRFATLLLAVAAIGFASVALQVLANRLLISLLGGTVYVFGAILAVFLLGIAAGGACGGDLLERSRRPWTALAAIALSFAAAVGAGVWLLARRAGGDDILAGALNLPLVEPGERVTAFTPFRYFRLAFGASATLLALATFAAGLFLPAALRLARDSIRAVGPLLGRVYLWNTLGSITGSLAAAYLLLPVLGLRVSFALVAALGGATAALLLVRARGAGERVPAWLALLAFGGAVGCGFAGFAPGPPPGAKDGLRTVFHREAAASAAKVCEVDDVAEPVPIRSLFVSGKAVASTIFIDRRLQLLLGFVSTLHHPDPRDVLCIGLGTGMTSGALAVAGGELTVVELSDAVIDAAREFAAYNAGLHYRPDTTIVHDDGRSYLARTTRRFDVISADPIDPCVSGSAYLYTVEYYRLGKSRLKPGGLMSQWIPIYDLSLEDIAGIVKTFRSVFPEATAWVTGYDLVLLGGESELAIDPVAIQARIDADPVLREMLRSVGVADAIDLVSTCFATAESLAAFGDRARAPNTDERPWIEFHAPRAAFGTYPLDVFEYFAATPEPPPLAPGVPVAIAAEIRAAQRRLKDGAAFFVEAIRATGSYGMARTEYIEFLRAPRDSEN